MILKLNLGCGSVRPFGWINIDSSLNASIQKIPFLGKLITKMFNPVMYESSNVIDKLLEKVIRSYVINFQKRWTDIGSSKRRKG